MSEQRGFRGTPGESYRPSNGTEGEGFISCWCAECERDREYREQDTNPCLILSRTMIYELDEEGYPEEWTYDEDGKPCCTAFTPVDDDDWESDQEPGDSDLEDDEEHGQGRLL